MIATVNPVFAAVARFAVCAKDSVVRFIAPIVSAKESLNKSDFVMARCLAHKKYRLVYHANGQKTTSAASIFFARALSHLVPFSGLELELIQSFPKCRRANLF